MEQNIFHKEYLKNYVEFIAAKKCIKHFSGTTRIGLWESNGMSEVNVENNSK